MLSRWRISATGPTHPTRPTSGHWQKITLTIQGAPKAPSRQGSSEAALKLGEPRGTIPGLGVGLQPEDAAAALEHAPMLRQLGLSHVICHHDPRRGHDARTLARQIEAVRAIGAEPWLEAVIETIDDAGAAAEVAALGRMAAAHGHPFATVLVSPAPDLKCTLPGSAWPPAPDAAGLYAATRAAFPRSRIGGGMFSFFTELNRKRPPTEALDLITFTTAAIFHAGDDRSMMETLECLPHIARTVPVIAEGLPWSVGPSAIGLRDNPYGEAPVANPGNIRQAVNYNDPRQRGIIGAAWNLGYFAAFAEGGAEAIALGGAVGPFGVLSVPMAFPQPCFDGKGELYPVWHVVRGLARLKGLPIRALRSSSDQPVRGIAVATADGTEMWLCNPSPYPIDVRLPEGFASIAVLDASRFVAACGQPDLLDEVSPLGAPSVSLDAYAVMRAVGSV
jgi:D-apionolactonase